MSKLEALDVVWALTHFRAYLLGHKTVVYADDAVLRSLLNTPNPSESWLGGAWHCKRFHLRYVIGLVARMGTHVRYQELSRRQESLKRPNNQPHLRSQVWTRTGTRGGGGGGGGGEREKEGA